MGKWGGKKYEGLGMRDVTFSLNEGIHRLQKKSKQKLLPVNPMKSNHKHYSNQQKAIYLNPYHIILINTFVLYNKPQ